MKKLLASLAAVTLAASTHAAVIAGWNFDADNSTTSAVSTSVDSGIVSTASVTMTAAAGLSIADAGNPLSGNSWGGFRANTAANFGAALTANDYYQFTISPNSSFQITSIDFSVIVREGVTELTRTHSFAIFSSADGYTTNYGSVTTVAGTTAPSVVTLNTTLPVYTGATTFRIASINNAAADFKVYYFGSSATGVNDIQINGVIPEPSTYAMIAGALALGLVAWRRRR